MVVKSKLSVVVLINLTVLGLTLPDKAYTQEFFVMQDKYQIVVFPCWRVIVR